MEHDGVERGAHLLLLQRRLSLPQLCLPPLQLLELLGLLQRGVLLRLRRLRRLLQDPLLLCPLLLPLLLFLRLLLLPARPSRLVSPASDSRSHRSERERGGASSEHKRC